MSVRVIAILIYLSSLIKSPAGFRGFLCPSFCQNSPCWRGLPAQSTAGPPPYRSVSVDPCQREFTTPIQEEIFAMVANRALDPSSKLAIEQWAADEVYLGDERVFQVQHFYRAMDFFLERTEKIQEDVFWSTAHTF
jgi:hypothetical protein